MVKNNNEKALFLNMLVIVMQPDKIEETHLQYSSELFHKHNETKLIKEITL